MYLDFIIPALQQGFDGSDLAAVHASGVTAVADGVGDGGDGGTSGHMWGLLNVRCQ